MNWPVACFWISQPEQGFFEELGRIRSPLGEGSDIDGGDRLPWMESSDGGNFEPLKSLDWQIHIYGLASSDLRRHPACGMRRSSAEHYAARPRAGAPLQPARVFL
jgi:hypothetical protein